ncbi:MAG: hypothetical protein SF053_21105 [Bacteroidia bacterium]|nr:hypothetical protein [Bacteroidia bacterium]
MESVTELRQSGKLEEALALALEQLQAAPDDETVIKETAWVYLSYFKRTCKNPDVEPALGYMDQILSVHPRLAHDTILGESIGWAIFRYAKFLLEQKPPRSHEVVSLLQKARGFAYSPEQQPSAYPALLRIALKVKDFFPDFLEYIDWWGLDNLQGEDFDPYETQGGKRLMALAEQVHIAVAKKLIATRDKAAIETFMERLNRLIHDHPDYVYPSNYRIQLLLALGRNQDVIAMLVPYLRRRRNEYWPWSVLGEAFMGVDDDKAIACFSQSLLVPGGKPEAQAHIHEHLAILLAGRQMYSEAKAEVEGLLRLKRDRKWNLTTPISELMQQPWYDQTQPMYNTRNLYRQVASLANEVLYEDIPIQTGVVTHIDPKTGKAWYMVGKEVQGSLQLNKCPDRLAVGDFVALRLEEHEGETNKWYSVISCRKTTTQLPDPEVAKPFKGRLIMPRDKEHGFVEPWIYIHPQMIRDGRLIPGQEVTGVAVIAYDKVRERWNWRALFVK